jgi:hypothetical protein
LSAGAFPAPISFEDVITEVPKMMQSQEIDDIEDDDDEDDEICDCEVCQAERNAKESAAEQLAIDRVSDTEWKICDFQESDHPLTYVLFASPIEGKPFENTCFTLVECDFDNFNNEFEDYQAFKREIWCAHMYIADPTRFEGIAAEIGHVLHAVKISNPIELAYFFGGVVHHRSVNMPPVPGVH